MQNSKAKKFCLDSDLFVIFCLKVASSSKLVGKESLIMNFTIKLIVNESFVGEIPNCWPHRFNKRFAHSLQRMPELIVTP